MNVSTFQIQSIINILLLNTSFFDSLWLMHGKMGIPFFPPLGKENKKKHKDYAGERTDAIFKLIT